jgi:hypothetical protein
MPKLPRMYTVVKDSFAFFRGARTSNEGEDWNLGAVGIVTEAEARRSYLRKLKNERRGAMRAKLARREGNHEPLRNSVDRLRTGGADLVSARPVNRGPYRKTGGWKTPRPAAFSRNDRRADTEA